MIEKTSAQQKLDDVVAKIGTTSDADREALKEEFFAAAIEVWNQDIAGEVELADGRKLTIHEL